MLPVDNLLIDGIIKGFSTLWSAKQLKEFAGRWVEEVQASERANEVREAYRKRLRELR